MVNIIQICKYKYIQKIELEEDENNRNSSFLDDEVFIQLLRFYKPAE